MLAQPVANGAAVPPGKGHGPPLLRRAAAACVAVRQLLDHEQLAREAQVPVALAWHLSKQSRADWQVVVLAVAVAWWRRPAGQQTVAEG